MQAQAYSHGTRPHAGLAAIPDSWNKAYKTRRRRAWIARIVLWGAVVALAITVLTFAGNVFG